MNRMEKPLAVSPHITQVRPNLWMWRSAVEMPAIQAWRAEQSISPRLQAGNPKRLNEFLAGRYALCQLYAAAGLEGITMADLPVLADGRVGGPARYRCSISHGQHQVVALVGCRDDYLGLGIDIEGLISQQRGQRLRRRVAPNDEQAVWQAAGLDESVGLTLTFSAKETLYKALNTQVSIGLRFGQARLFGIDLERGQMGLQLTTDLGPTYPCGHTFELSFEFDDASVLTYACVTESGSGT